MLASLMTEEANLLRGIQREVNRLKRELRRIQAFLQDADAKTEAEEDNMSNTRFTWHYVLITFGVDLLDSSLKLPAR